MNQQENVKRSFNFFLSMVIVLLLSLAFWYVWEEIYNGLIWIPLYQKGNWLMVSIYAILIYSFSHLYGGYKIDSYRITEIIYSNALALFFVNVITYLQASLIGRFFLNPLYFIVLTLFELGVVIIWAYCSNKIYFHIYPPFKMIMVYGHEESAELLAKMKQRDDKYAISETINTNVGYKEIIAKIGLYEAVVLSDVKSPLRNQLVKYCFNLDIPVYITPKISDVILRGAETVHLFDTPLLLTKSAGISFEGKLLKRIFDIILSIIAILITLPLMALVALAIKLDDQGPVLYCQQRLTIHAMPFGIYKFRSMKTDAEKDGVARLSVEDDDRITRVGKIIRKLRIDELPQLFNVLKGEMSFVGPRPERPEIANDYIKDLPEFNYRLKVKAGLTGYAQVLGKYNTNAYDKLKLDLMYIQDYSIFLDIKILLMTIKILFLPESTEGFQQNSYTKEELEEMIRTMNEDD